MITEYEAESRLRGEEGIISIDEFAHPEITGGELHVRVKCSSIAAMDRAKTLFDDEERDGMVFGVSAAALMQAGRKSL